MAQTELHYIPLDLMYGEKPNETDSVSRKDMSRGNGQVQLIPWKRIDRLTDIVVAEIDPIAKNGRY